MTEITGRSQMAKIRAFEKGFMAVQLLKLGAEIGVFNMLNESDDGFTVPELAKKLSLHEPYLKVWCQTAYYFEILDCDSEGRFKYQPFLKDILGDKSSFRYYLGNINLDIRVSEGMREAPDYFRSGEKAEMYNISAESSGFAYGGTKNIYMVYLFMILPKNEPLQNKLEQGVKFLDIGCGDGSLITQLAQNFKNCSFVGVNPDRFGIEDAEKKISEFNLGDRVSVQNIGGEKLTQEEEFDLVNMVVTLHEIPPAVRSAVVKQAYQALKTGGELLVIDFPYPNNLEDFRDPQYEYGILDQFYESVVGTVHLSTAEQTELLTSTGFKDIKRETIGSGMFEFVSATK